MLKFNYGRKPAIMVRLWATLMDVGPSPLPPPPRQSRILPAGYLANFVRAQHPACFSCRTLNHRAKLFGPRESSTAFDARRCCIANSGCHRCWMRSFLNYEGSTRSYLIIAGIIRRVTYLLLANTPRNVSKAKRLL